MYGRFDAALTLPNDVAPERRQELPYILRKGERSILGAL